MEKLWTAVRAGIFAAMTATMLWHWQVVEAEAEPFPVIVATDSTAAPAEAIFFAERVPTGHWVDLGTFKTTGYCNCRKCAGRWAGGPTKTGVIPVEGVTVAVDLKVIPLGSMVMIDGAIRWAQDTGVRGRHIDVYYDGHGVAWNHGVKKQHVFVWKEE